MAITVSNRVTFARDNGSPGDSLKVIANFRRARSNNCLFASLFNPGRCLSLFPCAVFCIPGFVNDTRSRTRSFKKLDKSEVIMSGGFDKM